ncbi:30S ribosomal protein S20 [Nitrosomonas stercoris]|uniref:Small ribosomal subunit protein bS20 n=1 Tax=Nitrosomonas stercoris TaxID=1444684 RepID=A0A4Y1YS58_9PROT|nr:30S ribosomal protein S20 [Nitrosomonas stercoris]
MANTAQARKRARQNVTRRERNSGLRSKLRTAIKNVQKAVVAGDKNMAESLFKSSVSVIDSITNKGIIHKNKAARHKSRLSSAIKAMD